MNLTRRTLFECFGFGVLVAPSYGYVSLSKANYQKSIIKQTVFTVENDSDKVKEVRLNGEIIEHAFYVNLDRGDGVGIVQYYPDPMEIDYCNCCIYKETGVGPVEVELKPSYVHDYRYKHGI